MAFVRSQNILDETGHLKFDLLSHSLESQSVLQKKSQLLDQMSVPTLTKRCELSNHDSKISITLAEMLKTNFLKVVSPSSEEEEEEEEEEERVYNNKHSDIVSALKDIKELNSNEVRAILSHFTKMGNDISCLSEMEKELINSHIFRGFGLPDREVFLTLMEEAQKTLGFGNLNRKRMIPLPQTSQLLTSNAMRTDALIYFDPTVYFTQISIDLDRMEAEEKEGGGEAAEENITTKKKGGKNAGKKNKTEETRKKSNQVLSPVFQLRQREIQQKVKRNIRHQLARRFHNMNSLKRYANSTGPVPIRNLSLSKLNKLKQMFESLKGDTTSYRAKKKRKKISEIKKNIKKRGGKNLLR